MAWSACSDGIRSAAVQQLRAPGLQTITNNAAQNISGEIAYQFTEEGSPHLIYFDIVIIWI